MSNFWILAQAEGDSPSSITSTPVNEEGEAITTIPADPNQPGQPVNQRPPKSIWSFLPFILIFVVIYFLIFRGPKKREQKQRQMVQALEKNDKVRTIGGIVGTVVDIKDDEVTLKIDESNNTKIKIATSAVGRNLTKEKK